MRACEASDINHSALLNHAPNHSSIHQISRQSDLYDLTSAIHKGDGFAVFISRLIFQQHGGEVEKVRTIRLLDPTRHHVHARDGTGSRPELAVDDPILLPVPLHFRSDLATMFDQGVVDRRRAAIQHPGRRQDQSAGAGREKRRDGRGALDDKLPDILGEIGRIFRRRPADEEIVEFGTVGHRRRRLRHKPAREQDRLHRRCDVEAIDLGRRLRQLARPELLHHFSRDVAYNVHRPCHVEQLHRRQEEAEVDFRHRWKVSRVQMKSEV